MEGSGIFSSLKFSPRRKANKLIVFQHSSGARGSTMLFMAGQYQLWISWTSFKYGLLCTDLQQQSKRRRPIKQDWLEVKTSMNCSTKAYHGLIPWKQKKTCPNVQFLVEKRQKPSNYITIQLPNYTIEHVANKLLTSPSTVRAAAPRTSSECWRGVFVVLWRPHAPLRSPSHPCRQLHAQQTQHCTLSHTKQYGQICCIKAVTGCMFCPTSARPTKRHYFSTTCLEAALVSPWLAASLKECEAVHSMRVAECIFYAGSLCACSVRSGLSCSLYLLSCFFV